MKFLSNMDGASKILEDAAHRFVSDTEKSTWNAKQNSLGSGTTSQYLRGDGSWATPPNTTYSAMSVSEGTTGTATSSRTVRADYLKQIIQSYIPSSLPANGGNADTVDGKHASDFALASQVLTNVPAGAKFTDTVYSHPSTHPASMITEDVSHRFVTDTEKSTWNNKANKATTLAGYGITDAATYGEFYNFQQEVYNEYSRYTHVHSYLPLSGGSLSGELNLNGNSLNTSGELNLTAGSATRQLNMGSLYLAASSNVGAIWIDIGTKNIMFNTRVNIRSYSYLATIEMGGYTYTSTSNWYSPHAVGTSTGGNINVRFATASTAAGARRYLVLGDTGTQWGGYLHVVVEHTTVGYGASFDGPFAVTLNSSYPANITSTFSVGGPVYHQHSHSDIVLYDHTSATSAKPVGVIMGTGNPPTASSVPRGTIYLKYV